MKRLLTIAASALLVARTVGNPIAAEIEYGVKGGVSVSNQVGHDSTRDFHPRVSVTGGLFALLPFGRHSALQPELICVFNGTRIDTAESDVLKWDFSYVHIPLLLKYYPPSLPIRLHAFTGPYVGINLSATAEVAGIAMDIVDTMSPLEMGWVVGLGAEIGRIAVDGRYSVAFTSNDRTGGLFMNSVLSFMAGYKFR